MQKRKGKLSMHKKLISTIVSLLLVSILATVSFADVYVHPYTRSDGTQVQGHYRSDPDGNRNNNWSTQGNYNPHTGQKGTRSVY